MADGIAGMLGKRPQLVYNENDAVACDGKEQSVYLRLVPPNKNEQSGLLQWPPLPSSEAFTIHTDVAACAKNIVVTGESAQGVLHGTWRLLHHLRTESEALMSALGTSTILESDAPTTPIRAWDLWDNADGSIERGYAGRSIIYPLGTVETSSAGNTSVRQRDYGRLLSSIGINLVLWDNVNACGHGNSNLLASAQISQLAPIVSFFYSYGIHSMLTPCFTSPQHLGGLHTSDPGALAVQQWWQHTARAIAAAWDTGAFRGFMFKGDSEGQPGPNMYNMTELEGANFFGDMLDSAVSYEDQRQHFPHHPSSSSSSSSSRRRRSAGSSSKNISDAIVIWRAFAHPPGPEGSLTNDQAIYQFRRFAGWEGRTRKNVVLQTKNGPLDFQVREPVHALFGALPSVNIICEVQATQEYLGQARHLSALAPQWEAYLSFELGAPDLDTSKDAGTSTATVMTLGDRVAGGPLTPFSGMAAVSNFGLDGNWTGHILSAVNTYAFGRLAWAPVSKATSASVSTSASASARASTVQMTASRAVGEWVNASFPGSSIHALAELTAMVLSSWETFESYTANLGWGYYSANGSAGHYCDHYCVDMPFRKSYTNTSKTHLGYQRTAFAASYNAPMNTTLASVETCPEELLLSFHNVPYTHQLRGERYGGMTVLEWIRSTHGAGAREAARYVSRWEALRGKLDMGSYDGSSADSSAGMAGSSFDDVVARLEVGATDAAKFSAEIVAYFDKLVGAPTPVPSPPSPTPAPVNGYDEHPLSFCPTTGGGNRSLDTTGVSMVECAVLCNTNPKCKCFDYSTGPSPKPQCRHIDIDSSKKEKMVLKPCKDRNAYVRTFVHKNVVKRRSTRGQA